MPNMHFLLYVIRFHAMLYTKLLLFDTLDSRNNCHNPLWCNICFDLSTYMFCIHLYQNFKFAYQKITSDVIWFSSNDHAWGKLPIIFLVAQKLECCYPLLCILTQVWSCLHTCSAFIYLHTCSAFIYAKISNQPKFIKLATQVANLSLHCLIMLLAQLSDSVDPQNV